MVPEIRHPPPYKFEHFTCFQTDLLTRIFLHEFKPYMMNLERINNFSIQPMQFMEDRIKISQLSSLSHPGIWLIKSKSRFSRCDEKRLKFHLRDLHLKIFHVLAGVGKYFYLAGLLNSPKVYGKMHTDLMSSSTSPAVRTKIFHVLGGVGKYFHLCCLSE